MLWTLKGRLYTLCMKVLMLGLLEAVRALESAGPQRIRVK